MPPCPDQTQAPHHARRNTRRLAVAVQYLAVRATRCPAPVAPWRARGRADTPRRSAHRQSIRDRPQRLTAQAPVHDHHQHAVSAVNAPDRHPVRPVTSTHQSGRPHRATLHLRRVATPSPAHDLRRGRAQQAASRAAFPTAIRQTRVMAATCHATHRSDAESRRNHRVHAPQKS